MTKRYTINRDLLVKIRNRVEKEAIDKGEVSDFKEAMRIVQKATIVGTIDAILLALVEERDGA